MKPNIHTDFILSPISDILIDAVSASAGIGNGIESYPMCKYVMQSVFLKLTGYQEQKIKCICWELATVDFDYRYNPNTKPLVGRSSYNDKQAIYKDLVKQIRKLSLSFNIKNDIDKDQILAKTRDTITDIFKDTNLSIWLQKSFNEYNDIWKHIEKEHFAMNNAHLFSEKK